MAFFVFPRVPLQESHPLSNIIFRQPTGAGVVVVLVLFLTLAPQKSARGEKTRHRTHAVLGGKISECVWEKRGVPGMG